MALNSVIQHVGDGSVLIGTECLNKLISMCGLTGKNKIKNKRSLKNTCFKKIKESGERSVLTFWFLIYMILDMLNETV